MVTLFRNKEPRPLSEARAKLAECRNHLMADIAKLAVLQASIEHGKLMESNLVKAIDDMEAVASRGKPEALARHSPPPPPKRPPAQ